MKRFTVKHVGKGRIVVAGENVVVTSNSIRRAKSAAKSMAIYNRNISRYANAEKEEMQSAIAIGSKDKAQLEAKYAGIAIPELKDLTRR